MLCRAERGAPGPRTGPNSAAESPGLFLFWFPSPAGRFLSAKALKSCRPTSSCAASRMAPTSSSASWSDRGAQREASHQRCST
eukprot:CAMPEP_0202910514 /NCGR_PEP_ID=MMETSP1392-20130828/52231_1 /ASSEMBLY_ACC=CAM_ASM_000868 /TAXON_ID=225041 /ORGANISM="Chlamydomonas chlamydogama, Strain SAG 11-48b" /LENGTH=82 /DNA_ID=CAMNT_0049600647 /DNA_START=604 /DNA_END=849 /DNA_ORIENTATION=+